MQNNFSEGDEAASAFGVRGKRVSTKMLELRLKTGEATAIGYHWLQSLSYTPNHRIEAIFSTHEVEITGRHLKELYHGLLEHRVPFVQESDSLYDDTPQTDAFISGIKIEPR